MKSEILETIDHLLDIATDPGVRFLLEAARRQQVEVEQAP